MIKAMVSRNESAETGRDGRNGGSGCHRKRDYQRDPIIELVVSNQVSVSFNDVKTPLTPSCSSTNDMPEVSELKKVSFGSGKTGTGRNEVAISVDLRPK